MRFQELLTAADRSGLLAWLTESRTDDLFVRVEHPHGGGGPGPWYLIRSIDDLDAILASFEWEELELDVFREPQLALRGVANDRFAQHVAAELPDDDWYAIVSLPEGRSGSAELEILGATEDKAELARIVLSAAGAPVAVGLHPLEGDRDSRKNSDLIFYVGVHRNRNQWPPYK
jgi:hypothetical protein